MNPNAGEIIRSARLRAGLSQSELARRSGIAQSSVSFYESATRQPLFDTVVNLLTACGEVVHFGGRRGRVDRGRAASDLEEVLELAELLPRRAASRELEFPALSRMR